MLVQSRCPRCHLPQCQGCVCWSCTSTRWCLTCFSEVPGWQNELPENWPLSLCVWARHQSRRRSPLLQMFCYTPGRQSQLDVPNISPGSSSSSQSPELRAGRRRTVTGEGWSQTNGFSRLAHTALLFGLFSSLHSQWCLSLSDCHV